MGVAGRGEKTDSPNVRVASRFELPPDCIGMGNGCISRSLGSNDNRFRRSDVQIVFQIRSDSVALHLLSIHDAVASIVRYTHIQKLGMTGLRNAGTQRFAQSDRRVAITNEPG